MVNWVLGNSLRGIFLRALIPGIEEPLLIPIAIPLRDKCYPHNLTHYQPIHVYLYEFINEMLYGNLEEFVILVVLKIIVLYF